MARERRRTDAGKSAAVGQQAQAVRAPVGKEPAAAVRADERSSAPRAAARHVREDVPAEEPSGRAPVRGGTSPGAWNYRDDVTRVVV